MRDQGRKLIPSAPCIPANSASRTAIQDSPRKGIPNRDPARDRLLENARRIRESEGRASSTAFKRHRYRANLDRDDRGHREEADQDQAIPASDWGTGARAPQGMRQKTTEKVFSRNHGIPLRKKMMRMRKSQNTRSRS
jgi:hypothetical protein